MRYTFFTHHCFCCYWLLRVLGLTKVCMKCNLDEYTCNTKNYILYFTGQGKYNNKYMCLACLKNELRTT